jgi:hypothetical protein
LGDTTMAAGPLMPVVPVVQAAMQTAIWELQDESVTTPATLL